MNIFCSATWEEVNINLGARSVRYCCHSRPIQFPDVLTVDWIKNNLQIQERKQFMLDNKKHKQCSFCYDQEETSNTSMRFLRNKKSLEQAIKSNQDANYVSKIEISFDNICNQSCIYCDENSSSLIAEEKGIKQKFVSYNSDDLKVIVEWIENIETSPTKFITLKFLGGEPTMSRNYFKFLDHLVSKCSDKHFLIHTITNCNTSEKGIQKIKSYLNKKNNWKWCFAISNESTYTLSENVRFKLNWENFDRCVKFYANEPNVFFVTAAMAQNIFTVKDLPNYFTYIDSIFTESKKDYGFVYNWVLSPTILSVAHLPSTFKKYITETRELVNASTSNLQKSSFLNYLNELEKLLGTKPLDEYQLKNWLDIQNTFKKNKLDVDLLLSQCKDT